MSIDLAIEVGLPVHRFPATSEEADIAEEALARELNKLTLDEQEKIIFDIHGIKTRYPEEEGISASLLLKELENEVEKIPKKEAYEQAVFMNESFVKDPNFEFMFLRALEYNVSAAAHMLVQHFEIKRQLFGDGEVLAREIRLSDLTPRDIEYMELGQSQVLPTRDAAGRTVMFMNAISVLEYLEEMTKCIFYQTMAILRDPEVQTMGTVWVFYNMRNTMVDLQTFAAVNRVDDALPLVGRGGHFCYNSHILRPLMAGFQLFFNRYDRHRIRSHFGPLDTVHFKLQTFGIPTNESPMRPDGSWSTEYHLEWLQAQRAYEEESAQKESTDSGADDDSVIIPRRFDVLLGKISRARMSTGTQRALHLVEMHRESYEKADKSEKTKLAETIVSIIQGSNGRFLKQHEQKKGCWVEVDDLVARQKISHWFRHMRWKTTKSQEDEENNIAAESNGGPATGTKIREGFGNEISEGMLRPSKRVWQNSNAAISAATSRIVSPGV